MVVAVALSILGGMLFGGLVMFLAGLDLWKRPLTQQNNRLRQQIDKITAAEQDLRQRLRLAAGRLAQEKRENQLKQAELKDTQQKLERDLIHTHTQYEKLEFKLQEVSKQNSSLTKRLAEEEDKLSELKMGLSGAKARYELQQTMINELKQERQILQNQLSTGRGEEAILRRDTAELQKQIGRLEASLNYAEQKAAEVDELEAEVRLQQSQIAELRGQLATGRLEQERLVDKLTAASKLFGSLESRYETAKQNLVRLEEVSVQNETLRQRFDEAVAQANLLKIQLKESQRDNLREIHGIGPVYMERLQAAGIDTFAKLAAASPEELRETAKLKPWQSNDPAEWITAAQEKLE